MSTSPSSSGISNLREYFSRDSKDKISPDLKHALSLLHIHDFEGLEERFLATDAFLEPWAVFRDSIFLVQPNAMPRPSSVKISNSCDGITRLDLLWFYTQFEEGMLRYDPRADKSTLDYTPDSSLHGIIDKSEWGVQEHEKHLYAWLLQEFKVGKAYNPLGFDYFELRNICSAWEAVFIPILNAVRASYNLKGRRHYGRLALFIESKCPSRLAFPEGNIGIPDAGTSSPTPFRIVSMPRKMNGREKAAAHKRSESVGVLTKKHYDDAEKELREVYPQYGGLVERPKFKLRMEEWIADQYARADWRKALENQARVHSSGPQRTLEDGNRSPIKRSLIAKKSKRKLSNDASPSPIKRYSDSIRRSFSLSTSKKKVSEEPKSPLHGVTRQLYFPDAKPREPPPPKPKFMYDPKNEYPAPYSTDVDKNSAHPSSPHQRASKESIYSSIRNSNPFLEEDKRHSEDQRALMSMYEPSSSPARWSDATPCLRHTDRSSSGGAEAKQYQIHRKKSHNNVRVPSYEGTKYVDEIALKNLNAGTKNTTRFNGNMSVAMHSARRPALILPVPYTGELLAVSGARSHHSPMYAAWPGTSLPEPVAWPGESPPKDAQWLRNDSYDNIVPPIPSKSPKRWGSNCAGVIDPCSQLRERKEPQSMTRFISKENIRAALGGLSRDNSLEDLTPPLPILPPAGELSRLLSPGDAKVGLQTYNTHMFPRKNTTVCRPDTPNSRRIGVSGQVRAEEARE